MFDIKAIERYLSTLERNNELADKVLKAYEASIEKNMNDEVLTAEQVLLYLKISKTTLLEEEKAGRIVPARIGKKGIKLYIKHDLLSYLNSQKSKIERRGKQ